MKKLILYCTLLFTLNSFGQNLIQNPSLENLKPYPYVVMETMWGDQFQESINNASGGWFRAWQSPSLINENLSDHSHYFTQFSTLDVDSIAYIEDNEIDFFFPARTGVQYALTASHTQVNDMFKEIFGYKLEENLTEGEEYCLKFHVKLGQGLVSGIDQIGAFFHDSLRNSYAFSEWDVWTSYMPQVMSPVGEPIIDSVNWTEISGSFIADGTEKYIYFGVFEQTENLTIDTLGSFFFPTSEIIYENYSNSIYFWDDFSLYQCEEIHYPANAGVDTCIKSQEIIQLGSHDYEDYFYEWRVNDSVFSTEGMPWVSPDTTSIYGLYQQDFAFNETWSQVSVVVVENPEDECVGLGVNEQLDSEIHVYPNPSNSLVHVNTKTAIEIWALKDALGRVVKSSKSIVESPFTIDVSALEIGLYYLELFSKEHKSIKRLVVRH